MDGTTSSYVSRVSDTPLDVEKPPSMQEETVAYCSDRDIPEGSVFVVTEIVYGGITLGDSNGPGGFKLVVGGTTIAETSSTHSPVSGRWTGKIEVTPDDLPDSYLEVRNSSTGSAEFIGNLLSPR